MIVKSLLFVRTRTKMLRHKITVFIDIIIIDSVV